MNSSCRLVFHTVPEGFRRAERVLVLQYEFSGIQKFIFGDVDVGVTQAEICRRSQFIETLTVSLRDRLAAQLRRSDRFRVLSLSSGKLLCAVSRRAGYERITELSEQLQRQIYCSAGIEMYFGVCEATVTADTKKRSGASLPACLSLETSRNKYRCANLCGISAAQWRLPEFCMPETAPVQEPAHSGSVMAAIKFDLDNLGAFFRGLEAFDLRKAASEALAETLKSAFSELPEVTPVFIGGDDIFAVAPMESVLHTVCEMHSRILHEIRTREALAPYREHFGISGGISRIRTDLGAVPLVYWFEQSEQALMKAKAVEGKNALCMPDCLLSWEQAETLDRVFQRNRALLCDGLTERQQAELYLSVREKRNRIMAVRKYARGLQMDGTEEAYVSAIQ